MSSFSFKDSVVIKRVHPKIVYVWSVVAEMSSELNIDCVVTSVSDGKHKEGSKHYSDPCEASDFRIWYLQDPLGFVKKLECRLGDDFDVILEHTHLHVEYDPK
jgi:hypothetical protein